MARRAAALVLLAVIALASSGVAYWVIWGGSSDTGPVHHSGSSARPAKVVRARASVPKSIESTAVSKPLPPEPPTTEQAQLTTEPADVAAEKPNVTAEKAGASQVSATSTPYVVLDGESVTVFTAKPSEGGRLYIKRRLETSRIPKSELDRLAAGVPVASEAEALSLIEGLSATTD